MQVIRRRKCCECLLGCDLSLKTKGKLSKRGMVRQLKARELIEMQSDYFKEIMKSQELS